ncbi:MAG: outer membrane beta-barrel protein, partial [candidate division WOR-3 bacterium]
MKRLGLIFFVLPGLVFSSAGLGGKIGIAFPEDLDATFTFGFFGRFAINPDLQIEPALNYWSQSEQAANHTLKVSDLSIDASLLWFFSRLKSNFNPYAGFGLGIHSVTV